MTESTDSIAVRDMISVASPLIKSLVDTFITPKLAVFKDKFKIGESDSFIPTENHFTEYYHRVYKKLAVVNTLVFNNSQRFLVDIFLPLTLVSTNDKRRRTKINGFPSTLSDQFGNILITDTAGMGKSTLMKTIFIDAVNKNLGIPIFIELRRLNGTKKLIDEIQEQLNSINKKFDSNLLLELLAEGGFIIILDGYDEIILSERDKVTTDIQEFISKVSNNRFFITSRPEKALASFGNFQEFKIEPLSKKEAFELLRKYDHQGQISSLLIKKLEEKEMVNIEEFLINPLLVSLLFTAFEHKQAIPFKKYLFYRQVYDANFESHDLTKGDSYTHDKYSKLEIDDFHCVLRHLGFNCFKLQRVEFSKDELLKLITESRTFCAGLDFKESDFLQDLLKTVPLFTQDGNYYRWSHKSLQEYFAAQFIYLDSKEKQSIILKKLYNHSNLEKFVNVLDLYYDMDYKTFRNTIELELLLEYKKYSNETYLSEFEGVDYKEVIRRKELLFLMDTFLFSTDMKDTDTPIEGGKLHKMVGDYEKKYTLNEKSFSGIVVNMPSSIFAIHYQNSKYQILILLANKKNSVVNINNMQRKQEKIEIDYNFEKEYELIKVPDSHLDKLNSKRNFGKLNEILMNTRIQSVEINHNKALEKLNEIQENIKLESKDDFLVNGI
jgi:hypothetical protein